MNDLFLRTLKDIHDAEKEIYKNLPKMAKSAGSKELKQAFEEHREETISRPLEECLARETGSKARLAMCRYRP
jgi:ferritin-like metal-binding protein YciE